MRPLTIIMLTFVLLFGLLWQFLWTSFGSAKLYQSFFQGIFSLSFGVTQNTSLPIHHSASKPQGLAIGWSLDTGAQNLIQTMQHSPGLYALAPKWIHVVNAYGDISFHLEPQVITYAHRHHIRVYAVIDNGFSGQMTHDWLRFRDRQDALIKTLTTLCKKDHLDGINVDFEGLSPMDRWNYSRFIQVLSQSLHAISRTVTVDLPPDLTVGQNTGPYDHQKIASAADAIFVMGYDEHWGGDPIAGPTASLPFVKRAIQDMLATHVPADKLLLGVPFYTENWTISSNGNVLTSSPISMLQEQSYETAHWHTSFLPNVGLDFIRYHQSGVIHEIWLEDLRALLLLYDLAVQNHLKGIACWYLGIEQPSAWSSLVASLHATSA